jgi:putative transposase
MKFAFIAKHRGIWPSDWLCGALGVSRGGFYAWLRRPRSRRSRSDEELSAKVRASFLASDRTYGTRRVWRGLLADGAWCGLHRIERLMRLQALKARPHRRRLPPDRGERRVVAVAANVLDRTFVASAPNRKWIADFTYIWTAEGWLYVAVVIDLFSRRVVGWSMSAEMTAQLVTDALVMAIWRRGKPDALLHHSDRPIHQRAVPEALVRSRHHLLDEGRASKQTVLRGKDDRNLDIAADPRSIEGDGVLMTTHPQIHAGGAKLQIAQDHLVEERRQLRVA